MRDRGILRIHPAFRLIALAEPPIVNSSSGQWLNSELLSLFLFHEMRPFDKREEIHIIRSKVIVVEFTVSTCLQPWINSHRILCCSSENPAKRY